MKTKTPRPRLNYRLTPAQLEVIHAALQGMDLLSNKRTLAIQCRTLDKTLRKQTEKLRKRREEALAAGGITQ